MERDYQRIEQELTEQKKDWGKLALYISLLSVLLMVVLFFGLNQNVAGVEEGVQRLETQTLPAMAEKVEGFERRMSEMERLPEMARQVLISAMIEEMIAKTEYLSGQLPEGQGTEKLDQVRSLLNEVKP